MHFSWHSFELRFVVSEHGLILSSTFDPVCESPPVQSHLIRKHISSLVRTTLNRIFLFLSITLKHSLLSRPNGNSTHYYTTFSGNLLKSNDNKTVRDLEGCTNVLFSGVPLFSNTLIPIPSLGSCFDHVYIFWTTFND